MTLRAIEDVLQALTASILGLDPDTGVRIAWPTDGAPAWKIGEDIAFLQLTEEDDRYNRERFHKDTDVVSPEGLERETKYTRVWRAMWILYGPNSFDNSQKLRSYMFNQENHDTLAKNNMYLVPDITAPRRVPELFEGMWWERTDMHMIFNELVDEHQTVQYVKSVHVTVENDAVPPVVREIDIP